MLGDKTRKMILNECAQDACSLNSLLARLPPLQGGGKNGLLLTGILDRVEEGCVCGSNTCLLCANSVTSTVTAAVPLKKKSWYVCRRLIYFTYADILYLQWKHDLGKKKGAHHSLFAKHCLHL